MYYNKKLTFSFLLLFPPLQAQRVSKICTMEVDATNKPKPSEVGMWKTLISTLTSNIHNCGSNLEMIVNMIRTDLTYDDPGLFPPGLLTTDAERLACRACNFWLINQLLRIATMDSYNRYELFCISKDFTLICLCPIFQHLFQLHASPERNRRCLLYKAALASARDVY